MRALIKSYRCNHERLIFAYDACTLMLNPCKCHGSFLECLLGCQVARVLVVSLQLVGLFLCRKLLLLLSIRVLVFDLILIQPKTSYVLLEIFNKDVS